MRAASPGRVRFGDFELDTVSGELRPTETADGADRTVLREQVFQILLMLVEREGAIVTRDDIKSRLWAEDTVVDFDRSINATIKALRRALGDSADHPRYIETLARRGYRLMLAVERLESEPDTPLGKEEQRSEPVMPVNDGPIDKDALLSPSRTWPRGPAIALALVAMVLLAGGYSSWRHFHPTQPAATQKIMLAVLPFENLTGDPNKEYLADGLTEQTISVLGRLNPERLGVIARTSVMGYKHKTERLDQVGRDLAVQYVLENSLRQSGDHTRLTAQLIQVKDQTHLWSKDYDYRSQDILSIEDDLAKAVAREIQLHLPSPQRTSVVRSRPINPEAFDAYLQGYYHFQRNTEPDTKLAAVYYERATQLDPSYATAWAGLSRVRKWEAMTGQVPADEGYRTAREAVRRALDLDPNLVEAHIQLGRIQQQVDFDWAGGDASFQRAVALEPGNAESLNMAAGSAILLGHLDQALELNRKAIALDPLNAGSWSALAETEFYLGRLSEAEADSKKSLELSPDVWPGPILLSRIYLMQGRPQDALAEVKLVQYGPSRTFLYAVAYFALGRRQESDAALHELFTTYHGANTYQIAEAYALRNQPDEAFKWLDRAFTQRNSGLIETRVDPFLNGLHQDPRFAELLKKLGLPNE